MRPESVVAARVPIPPPPERVKDHDPISFLVPGVVTFVSFFLVTWLLAGDDVCRGVCGLAVLTIWVGLIAEPFVVLIVLSVRAADVTGRVSFPVRSILAIAVPACVWGGEMLGELANGTASSSILMFPLLVAVAVLFSWPIAFLVTTLTSWTLEARRARLRRRSPPPPRPDH